MPERRPDQLVGEVIEIHELLVRTGSMEEYLFPTSRLRIQPAGDLLLSVALPTASLLYKRFPGRGYRLLVQGGTHDAFDVSSVMDEKPDTLVRPGVRAGNIFKGLKVFLDEYAQGTVENSIWTPKGPAQVLNHIAHLIQTGKLRLEDLQGFVETRIRQNSLPGVAQQAANSRDQVQQPITREAPAVPAPRVAPTATITPRPVSDSHGVRELEFAELIRRNAETRASLLPGGSGSPSIVPVGAIRPGGSAARIADSSDVQRRQEPSEKNRITAANVADVVTRLLNDPPMTRETDLVLRDYFSYLAKELKKISTGMEFPVFLYDREFLNLEQIRQFVNVDGDAINLIKAVVEARGRGNSGQPGPWFWNTSKVEDLEKTFAACGQSYAEAYEAMNPK